MLNTTLLVNLLIDGAPCVGEFYVEHNGAAEERASRERQ